MSGIVHWEVRLNAGVSGAETNSRIFNSSVGSFIKKRSEKKQNYF